MMLSRSREKFRSARHQILILQPLENCRTQEAHAVATLLRRARKARLLRVALGHLAQPVRVARGNRLFLSLTVPAVVSLSLTW